MKQERKQELKHDLFNNIATAVLGSLYTFVEKLLRIMIPSIIHEIIPLTSNGHGMEAQWRSLCTHYHQPTEFFSEIAEISAQKGRIRTCQNFSAVSDSLT